MKNKTTINTKTQRIPVDLHCHSTISDGSYSIKNVLNLVKKNGGKYIAITDHDSVNGISDAKNYSSLIDLKLISGVEISVTWEEKFLVHIVGLMVDENNNMLLENLHQLRMLRQKRGKEMAFKLAKAGIPNALEGAMEFCTNEDSLSRTHFARFLVKQGYAKINNVFDKFLGPNKPAYVFQRWASLKDTLTWIKESGGIAIIAHPARYSFTNTKLIRLISEFKAYGGLGIEVISSSHSENDVRNIGIIAKNENLLASVGSDFHNTNEFKRGIIAGINHLPPDHLKTVFDLLGIDLRNEL